MPNLNTKICSKYIFVSNFFHFYATYKNSMNLVGKLINKGFCEKSVTQMSTLGVFKLRSNRKLKFFDKNQVRQFQSSKRFNVKAAQHSNKIHQLHLKKKFTGCSITECLNRLLCIYCILRWYGGMGVWVCRLS